MPQMEPDAQTSLAVFAGPASPALGAAVARALGVALGKRVLERFPDGEWRVEVEDSVRGHDVYIVQATSPPVGENLLALLLLADACRRAGAARLTAVVPYFGYARQDRRASGRGPVGARLMADLIGAGRLSRVVAVDLHSGALEGFFELPLEHLTSVPLLAAAVRPYVPENGVVVAPDLGAAKLADRYARLLELPAAVVHKKRVSGDAVSVSGVTGDVKGRVPILVDDMITTAATAVAAIEALLAEGCEPGIVLVATHGLFVGPAVERLAGVPIRRVIVTDSVGAPERLPSPIQIVGLDALLATAIQRLHSDSSMQGMLLHG